MSDFYPPTRGGLEFHVQALAEGLSHRGHEVHVATMTEESTSSDSVTVHTFAPQLTRALPHKEPDRRFHPPLPDPTLWRPLNRLVASIRPDVVHAHSWMAASLRRNPLDPPLVFTAHDYSLTCELRTLMHRQREPCAGPAAGKCLACATRVLGALPALGLGWSTAVGRRLLKMDALIAVSETVASELRGAVSAPITVIPNFLPDQFGEAENLTGAPSFGAPLAPFVMYAGDPGYHKGLPWLLSLWASPEAPDIDLLAASLGSMRQPLPQRVHLRQLTRTQVQVAWKEAKVAVVPSLWREPFPTSALEAMACGTPVVATRVGGITDLIVDGLNGLLVEPGDTSALFERITRLLKNPGLRLRIGEAGRETAAFYRAAMFMPAIEAVYESVLRA